MTEDEARRRLAEVASYAKVEKGTSLSARRLAGIAKGSPMLAGELALLSGFFSRIEASQNGAG